MPRGRSPRQRRDRTGHKGPRRAAEELPDPLERDEEVPPAVIAIVGRPNVGKSTLLNALVGSRVAIVEETPGVTRDRIEVICTLADRTVRVVDTGGVGIVDRQGLENHVEGQVAQAIEEAHLVLFVVDAREGVQALDRRVANLLRNSEAPVLLIANKVETEEAAWSLGELETLGHGSPMPISAKEKAGLVDVEERLEALLPEGPVAPRKLPPPELKLAFVGRMNAGKSSLVNALLERDRMIVSEIPGTTRDTVDIRFERDGQAVVLIDTAGIRKERIVSGSVEFYAQRRAEKAMRRADVTALVVDAVDDVARLDRRIASYALDHHEPVIVVANKWDLIDDAAGARRDYAKYFHDALPGLRWAPVVYVSALERRGLGALLSVAWRLRAQSQTRVSTAEVNRALVAAQELRAPKPFKGKRGNVYYGTQADVSPPTFILFVNDPDLFEASYVRYLENQFRQQLPFTEIPVKFILRARPRSPSKTG